MTGNQQKIFRTLKWIFYPVALLMMLDFILKFIGHSPLEGSEKSNELFEMIDSVIMMVVFLVVSVGVLALMQQFFTKGLTQPKDTLEAANAKLLMKVEPGNQLVGNLILFVIVLGFSAMLNLILFKPLFIFEQEQIDQFELTEKFIFGFFYIIAHFLLLVFGMRLFKGMPPVFIATEKGFCYEPAGVSSGWILWEDVVEVRESSVLYGSGVNNGPVLMPVLGIKLMNPEEYNAAAFAPLLQRVVSLGQKLNNYQTEGVGDLLLRPSDFGNDYGKVIALFKQKSSAAFEYHSLTE
jgi:hypothetical protein